MPIACHQLNAEMPLKNKTGLQQPAITETCNQPLVFFRIAHTSATK